jgi:lactoylglutathione lyase
MNNDINTSLMPSRILYPMIRVSELDRSLTFYIEALGMRELRRESFTEGRFTLVFIGYGEEVSSTVLELTYNWDVQRYEHGSGYGHLALEVADIKRTCERLAGMGVKIVRDPGPMKFAADESRSREIIAFIEDPDGYRIELIERT